jgi:hypothetical protein
VTVAYDHVAALFELVETPEAGRVLRPIQSEDRDGCFSLGGLPDGDFLVETDMFARILGAIGLQQQRPLRG